MALTFLLPAIITWLSAGAPTSQLALTGLSASILAALLAYFKEISGGVSSASPTGLTPTPARSTAVVAIPELVAGPNEH